MFTGLGARGVSPNPFCLGIIWAGPSKQVSTPGRFRATRLLVVPGILNCRLLTVETFSKEDRAIFKDTFPSAAIDTTKWTVVDGATVESIDVGEPSRRYSF